MDRKLLSGVGEQEETIRYLATFGYLAYAVYICSDVGLNVEYVKETHD